MNFCCSKISLVLFTPQVLYLSDLFTEQQQFQWMLDRFLEVQRNHPQEDELITQYVVVGVCKAAAIVGMVRISWCIYIKRKGFVCIRAKGTSLPDGFIENQSNVHIEQRQRSKKILFAFAVAQCK